MLLPISTSRMSPGRGSVVAHIGSTGDLGESCTIPTATNESNGAGISDTLFRNDSTGDVGFYAISNGALTGWHDIEAPRPPTTW